MSSIVKFGLPLMFAALGLCASASQAAAQTLTTLHSFTMAEDGHSTAGLVLATDSNFYGTTSGGFSTGEASAGTVFRITPSGVLTTLYTFCSQSGCSDGIYPTGGVIQATDGNLYGTTSGGGASGTNSAGTVFKITLSGSLTVLHSFNVTDGENPSAELVQGTDGNFYGTTARGGANACHFKAGSGITTGCGTVFKITPTGTLTTLVNFSQANGFYSLSPLIQASDGNFYGTTVRGGSATVPGIGVVFQMTPAGTLTVLHRFGGTDGANAYGGLVEGTDGNFYGTTYAGGSGSGTVFKITSSGALTTLHSFGNGEGYGPQAALIQATDGNFYGTASGNGADENTIFKMTPSGTLTVLHTFNGTDGSTPVSTLVEGANHDLYGTTEFGANSACTGGCGTVFSLAAGL